MPVGRDEVKFEIIEKPIGYMMATKAFHLTGDLSEDEPSLCRIYGITSENPYSGYYVGMWLLGYGYFHVLFPKETTKPLTDEDVEKWGATRIQIASQTPQGFNKDDLRASREKVAQMEKEQLERIYKR